jgi:hypothetical protein
MYKTTNLINNKFYIGVHKTNNLDDGYLGSGKYFNSSLNKYGKENFKREILEFFDSKKEMYLKEKEIVNEDFIKQENNYNIKIGGLGGWDHLKKIGKLHPFYGRHHTNETKTKISIIKKGKITSKTTKQKISLKIKNFYKNGGITFKGKHHTEETKIKIGKANSINQIGSSNNQFGTIWIYNEKLKQNKKRKINYLD